jgi:phage repressor protein C with HTH and peptisase S24 domain
MSETIWPGTSNSASLLVKRLLIHPIGRRVTLQSDNPAYADLPDCALDDIYCVGRVIWVGRKVS